MLWDGEIVFFDEGGRMTKFELTELGAVRSKEGGEAGTGITKVGRKDRKVGEKGHIPGRKDIKSVVIQ